VKILRNVPVSVISANEGKENCSLLVIYKWSIKLKFMHKSEFGQVL
jgi:hypothetical protein